MIGIGLLTLVPGAVGGSETYARELVRGLARVGTLDYRVFVSAAAADVGDGLPTVVSRRYRSSSSMPGRAAAMASAIAFAPRLRDELELDRLEGMHFPLTTSVPPVRVPTITTVHDVAHDLFPQYFSAADRAYRRLVYHRAARNSRFVIVPTEHVKQTVVARLGIPEERIRTIAYALDHDRFKPPEQASERDRFLLYPANRWPHKNHERLIDAFCLVRQQRPELRLVLTGVGHENSPSVEGVDVRGHIPLDDLVGLYQAATALVFPSLYEGFGQPPLEAMACGCPVATAWTGSLPDVCGDAARLFDPTSVDAIAEAIDDVLVHSAVYAAKGLRRAAEFSWDRTASEHEAVYCELQASG
jgi:glycosyltransferase involved in cell wall biosynthesis